MEIGRKIKRGEGVQDNTFWLNVRCIKPIPSFLLYHIIYFCQVFFCKKLYTNYDVVTISSSLNITICHMVVEVGSFKTSMGSVNTAGSKLLSIRLFIPMFLHFFSRKFGIYFLPVGQPETLGSIFAIITLNSYALQRLLIITLSVLAFQPSPIFPDTLYTLLHKGAIYITFRSYVIFTQARYAYAVLL